MNVMRKRVSIVVTTYTNDRLHDVIELIESVRCQTYHMIELILVVEEARIMYENLMYYLRKNSLHGVHIIFSQKKLGLSSARNLGVEASTGDIIAFVDDDVILEPTWAEELVKVYDDLTIIGATGSSEPLWIGHSLTWLPKEFYWLIGCSGFVNDRMTEVRNVWGWNMSFRRDVFDKGCRFCETYGLRAGAKEAWGQRPPEDVDISLKSIVRTGGRIIYAPQVRVKHKVNPRRFTFRLIAEKAFFMGRQRRQIKILYRNLGSDLLTMEKTLLRRILTNTFPWILRNVFKKPVEAWKQFSITLIILLLVFLGYCTYHQNRGTI